MSKIKKFFKNPTGVLSYFRRAILRLFLVRRVKKNGQNFFKYKDTVYPAYLNNQSAAPFIFPKAEKYCRGTGIDVGAGTSPYPGAAAIQSEKHQNAYQLDDFPDASLDYVFSSHCLEHLDRWQDALVLWIRKLKPGGILFLYLPHESMALWRPKGLWAGNDHKWIPTAEALSQFLTQEKMRIVECNPERDEYWSFHIVARKPR